MNFTRKETYLAAFTAGMLALGAQAQAAQTAAAASSGDEVPGVAQKSVTNIPEKSFFEQMKENGYRATWFADMAGPSLGQPGSLRTNADGDINPDDPINVYNSATFGYMVSDDYQIYANPRFTFQPVRGTDLTFHEARVGARLPFSFKSGNLSSAFYKAYLGLPTTGSLQDAGLITYLGMTQHTAYSAGRWTLGVFTHLRPYAWTDFSSKRLLLTAATPYLSYQVNSSLTADVVYDMAAGLTAGAGFSSLGTYLSPRVNWSPLADLTLTPNIKMYPSGNLNLDSTTFNLEVAGTIF